MAETMTIDESLLYPGDTIRFDFLLKGTNQTLLDLAIRKVKETIYADDRLDYQGSEIVTEVDKTGLEGGVREVQVLRIYATVRRYRRDAHPELQKAGIGAVSIGTLIAVISAAVAVYAAAVTIRGHGVTRTSQAIVAEVESIRTDPNLSDEAKQAALETLGKATPQQPKSIGSGLAALGGGLATTAMIIGVLWAVSLSSRRRGID